MLGKCPSRIKGVREFEAVLFILLCLRKFEQAKGVAYFMVKNGFPDTFYIGRGHFCSNRKNDITVRNSNL